MSHGLVREPTDEELMIRASIAQLIGREAPPDALARLRHAGSKADLGLYRTVAELGWLGMLVPEAYGGAGMPLATCAAAYEELGRAPLTGPVLTSAVIATLIVLEGGTEDQKHAILPSMIAGERIVALAAMDSGRGWDPSFVNAVAAPAHGGFRLSGRKDYVPDGATAQTLICAARRPDEGANDVSLFVVEADAPGVGVEPLGGLPFGISRVRLDAVEVPHHSMVGGPGDGWEILDRAALRALPVLCAFIVGACLEVFDFTLEYTRQRSAFGQLIGRFQRVQDHVVELANQMDAARWMTAELLGNLEAGVASQADVHEAAAVAKDAYFQVCNYSHMVHAGPGTDLDHPLMGHTIASRALYQLLGTPDHHKRRMMDLRFPPAAAEDR